MMGRRSSWLVAGIFGGLVAGALAALMASLFTFVFVWAFVFSRFPSAERLMSTAPVVVGVAVLLGVFAASILLTIAAARRAELRASAGPSAAARENRRAAAALGISVIGLLAAGGLVALVKGQNEAVKRRARAREEVRESFDRDRFVVASLEAPPRNGGHDVSVTLKGHRSGNYRLSVTVRENLYHKELFRYEQRLHLDRGERSLELSIDDALLADRYRERVLSGPAGSVWVKESFTLEAVLVPEEQADVAGVMPLAVSRPLPVDFHVDWPGTPVR